MKNLKNRAIALILTLAMCLSTTSAAFADEELNDAVMSPAEMTVEETAADEIKEKTAEANEEKAEEDAAPEKTGEEVAAEEKPAAETETVDEFVEEKEESEEVLSEKPAEEQVKEAVAEKTEEKAEEAVLEKNEEKLVSEEKPEAEFVEATEKTDEILSEKLADEQVKEAVVEKIEEKAEEPALKKSEEKAAAEIKPSAELIETAEKAEENLPEAEMVAEPVEETIEEPEEEPFVSDVVSINVTGTFTWYLENPDRTIQLTGTNYKSTSKTAANKADDQEIIWTSGNEDLATVDENGLVTILTAEPTSSKANNKITITAAAKNDPSVKITKTITVKNIAASNITMSISSASSATVGTDLQLTVKFNPEYAIEALGLEDAQINWTLENGTGEAAVDENGLLTPVKAGTVKITATNGFNTAKTTKTVTIKAPVLVTKLYMSPTSAKLTIKDGDALTKQLKVTTSPSNATDKSVTWSSDNEEVAVVDETGLVTAVGEGTAVISAVSVSNPDVAATSKITVDRYVPIESLSISDWMTGRESKEMTVITGGYADLIVKTNPNNASNKSLTWSCSDESVLEMIPQGTYNAIEALQPGTAVVTVTSADDPEISAQIKINVIDPGELTYDIHVTHYFTKVFAGDYLLDGVPSSYEFKIDGGTMTEKAGTLVHADEYIFQPPLVYPYTFEYEGETYTLNGSAVMALGNNLTEEFELKSDVEIIYIYSAVAPYSLTVNYIDEDTNEAIKDAYVYNYSCMAGYIEVPYDLSKFVAKQKNFETYDFVRTEGDVLGSWDEDHMNKVVNLYYTLKEHTVTYEYTGKVPESAPEIPAAASYKVGAKVGAADVPALTGYVFSGWVGEVDTMPNKDVTVSGSWTPVTGLYYTVNYLEKETGKVLAEKKVVDGCTFGDKVTEDAIDIKGYNKSNAAAASITISADPEDNEINFYYTLKEHTVTYEYTGEVPEGAPAVPAAATYKFGAKVAEAEVPVMTGYEFSGWTGEVDAMPDEDVKVTGSWTPVTGLCYTVNYLEEETGKALAEKKVVNGFTFGEEVTEDAIDIKGYNKSDVTTATITISADPEDNEINFYYTLKEHTVTYEYIGEVPEGAPALPAAATYKFGVKVAAAEVPALIGYEFSGWVGEVDTMPDEDVKVTGSWTLVSGLYYTVNYLEEETDKVLAEKKIVDGRTFGEEVTEDAIDINGYNKGDVTTATITISADSADNEINFYYTAIESSTSKDENDVTKTPKTEENETIEDGDTPLAPIVGEESVEEDWEEELASNEVPMAAYTAEEETLVADNELPKTPFTGDDRNTAAWLALSLFSLAGIAMLSKRKEEEEM